MAAVGSGWGGKWVTFSQGLRPRAEQAPPLRPKGYWAAGKSTGGLKFKTSERPAAEAGLLGVRFFRWTEVQLPPAEAGGCHGAAPLE